MCCSPQFTGTPMKNWIIGCCTPPAVKNREQNSSAERNKWLSLFTIIITVQSFKFESLLILISFLTSFSSEWNVCSDLTSYGIGWYDMTWWGGARPKRLHLPEMLAAAALHCRTGGPADEAVWHQAVAQAQDMLSIVMNGPPWPCHYREK